MLVGPKEGASELSGDPAHPHGMALVPFCADRPAADARLVLAARAGDAASLGLLLQRYRSSLFALALAVLDHKHEAEDAVADTMLTALTHLAEIADSHAVGGWLHAVLRNHCLMALRRRRARPLLDEEEGEAELAARVDPRCVEQQVAGAELREWVWRALERLSEPQRAVVMLRYFSRCEAYDDIAAVLSVPVGTVRSRLFDARQKLAHELLSCAGPEADPDLALARRQAEAYAQLLGEAYEQQRTSDYLDAHAEDFRLHWSDGRERRGRQLLRAQVEGDLTAGVRMDPQAVMASGSIAVVEARFQSPASDPEHCPPGIVLVLWRGERGTVERANAHHEPRAKSRQV